MASSPAQPERPSASAAPSTGALVPTGPGPVGAPARLSGWARALGPWFEDIEIDPEAAARLHQAHEQGIVVHTLRMRRLIDPLYIRYLLHGLKLPSPTWSHAESGGDLDGEVAALVAAVERGGSALLFLKRARTLMNHRTAMSQPHIEALVALQRRIDRPILLLPESLLWVRRANDVRKTIIGAIFGDRDAPGRLREIAGFFWHLEGSRFHVGAPIDLSAVLEREPDSSDRIIAKKVRWTLLQHLSREEQIRTGPMQRSAARTRQNVLKDAALRRFVQAQAEEGKESGQALEKRADEMLRQMAADMRYGWLRVLDAIIDVVWSRIYDGIVVDPEGLALVRRAARRGPVVLVPSHKSHIDYLVLSQVFFKDNMMPPHIAAGDNLNFWPMGFIFRRSGAFFIRRSFKGDKLYAQVFAAYLRRLLKEGHAVEFFIEGGRSRTGKLLPPRMGMLSMCVDPVFEGAVSDVQFIPVSISYEKVVEAKSYARELAGGAKRKEDVTALLSSAQVLRSKYGRVYVDFAEPVSLRVFAASRGVDVAAEDEDEGAGGPRRSLVTQLGHRIVYGINAATRVTPTSVAALVILARARRGLAQEDLFDRAAHVVDFLGSLGARLSGSLRPDTMQAALREALGRFAQDGLLLMTPAADGETIYQATDAGRIALDYYKNNILHFFVPHAIVALAVRWASGTGATTEDVVDRARRLSRLFKYEFSFRTDRDFLTNFEQAAATLVARRTVDRGTEGGAARWSITRQGQTEAKELSGLLAVFLEGYRLAAEALPECAEKGVVKRRFVEEALTRASRAVLEGRILRAEAAAQPILQIAMKVLQERGILAAGSTIAVDDEAGRLAFIEELDELLAVI